MSFGPISSAPISSFSGGPPGPPGPPGPSGVLPFHNFDPQEIHCRWNANYASAQVNKKFVGVPLGVYFGFVPALTSGSLVLTLNVDPNFGVSFARTRSLLDEQEIDVIFDQPITLDFTGHDFVLNPTVYVKLHASVAVGQPTSAEVFSDALAPAALTEQLICVVTKPGADLVVDSTEPANRSNPFAWTSAAYGYGFMKDSAVEALLAAVDMVNEVAAARLDLSGTTHPWNPPIDYGLDDRVGADLEPTAIAARLALFVRVVRSNTYTAPATTNEFDVSTSFSEFSRAHLPAVSFDPDGSETQPGVITDGDVENRSVCFLVNDATRERLLDSDRTVIYGRLSATTTPITGTVAFTNGSAAVVGAGTLFLTELVIGAAIEGADGRLYVVQSIADDLNLTLSALYVGPTTLALPTARRVYTLNTYRVFNNNEVDHSVQVGTVFHFYFPVWVRLDDAVFDATNYMLASGEPAPLPDAAVGVKGKVLLHPGTVGGLAGAVNSVKDAGGIVGSGQPVWGLDFGGVAAGAPGVANISAAGPTGPEGPGGGAPGPTGPTGPPGIGFDLYSVPFNDGPLLVTPPGGWPSLTILTHTVNLPGPPKYVHGGLAQWEDNSGQVDGSDHVLQLAPIISGNQVTVRYQTANLALYGAPAVTSVRLFLSAAG